MGDTAAEVTTAARVHRCLDSGLSIVVGSVDAQNIPSCCRAIAISSADDLGTVTVYVPVATSQDTIHNVATTKRLAITASNPPDHRTTQLKGTTIEARLARDDEQAFLRERLDAFVDVLEKYGFPRGLARRLAYWPAFALTIRVEEMFEQTPGPQAGNRIR
jgi:hypothetical protein